jgi:tRNA dimethylallyltransferase
MSSAIALVGPTAIGKTGVAIKIAQRFYCEIIGVDSMQIYRYMDIGTAKPTAAERALVPHHLVDMVDPADDYTVARFIEDALRAVDEIRGRGHIPLFTGGTGLYLKGIIDGVFEQAPDERFADRQEEVREKLKSRLEQEGRHVLYKELQLCDPVSAERIHPNDTHRLLRGLEIFQITGKPWSEHLERQRQVSSSPLQGKVLKLGLYAERDFLYERINQRVDLMIREGLLDEVEKLLELGYGAELKSMQSIGYRHMVDYLAGKRGWQETISLLARDTRRYAKRQFTWFRKDPEIEWFTPDQFDEISACVEKFLADEALNFQT